MVSVPMGESDKVYINEPDELISALGDFEPFTLCTPDEIFCSDIPGFGSETILIMGLLEIGFWLICAWYAGRKLKLYQVRKQQKAQKAQDRQKTVLHEQ